MTAPDGALDLLSGVVLEDGSRWAERATDWQWETARVLLDRDEPPFRWESRPRGGSKTTDVAAILLVAMLLSMPAGATCDAYAGDRDQARLLRDALAGLVRRTPALAGLIRVDQYRATTTSGVVLEVMAADAASAYGRRPYFVVVDELCQWPVTDNARELWAAIASSMPKIPGARLAVISTSGDPTHWSRKVRDSAVTSPLWSVAEIPGPLPWISEAQLEEQRRILTDSQFARLHLNQWAAGEDRLVRPEDLAAAVVLAGPQEPKEGCQYVIALDLGIKHDRSVAAVCHAEALTDGREGRRVVLDRMQVWSGTRSNPVNLTEVEEWLFEAAGRYRHAKIVADPWQAVGLLQRLQSRGKWVEEYPFTTASIGRFASELMVTLRERRIALPDDEDLLDELARVRLKENVPGVLRLDHASGEHDDRAVALALAVLNISAVGEQTVEFYFGDDASDGRALDGSELLLQMGPYAIRRQDTLDGYLDTIGRWDGLGW